MTGAGYGPGASHPCRAKKKARGLHLPGLFIHWGCGHTMLPTSRTGLSNGATATQTSAPQIHDRGLRPEVKHHPTIPYLARIAEPSEIRTRTSGVTNPRVCKELPGYAHHWTHATPAADDLEPCDPRTIRPATFGPARASGVLNLAGLMCAPTVRVAMGLTLERENARRHPCCGAKRHGEAPSKGGGQTRHRRRASRELSVVGERIYPSPGNGSVHGRGPDRVSPPTAASPPGPGRGEAYPASAGAKHRTAGTRGRGTTTVRGLRR